MMILKKIILISGSIAVFFSINVQAAESFNQMLTAFKSNEKLFVVERESESLAVIDQGMPKGSISGMHNMNHGVVKFYDKDGYVISRDGYIAKFDPESEKILEE